MIEIKNLNKIYKSNKLVSINNTSLTLPDKGLITLLGPSGSGKTTLLNVIGGLDSFKSGNIDYGTYKIDKYSMGKIDKFRNKNISYIFQNYYLISDLTVLENLRLSLEISDIYDKEEQDKRIFEALNAVKMYKFRKKRVDQLSGGQQQRIAIARALTKQNKLIIADEPTGNLDSKNSIEVMNILKHISKTSLVLLVTHNETLANYYSDQIINIKDGTITNTFIPSESSLDSLDNTIYLKDLECEKVDNNYKINIYNNENNHFNLDIILINGTYYLKSDRPIKLLKDSNLTVLDKHKTEIKKEEITETKYSNEDFKSDKTISKRKKLHKKFIDALKNVNKVKKSAKFLRFGLFLMGVGFAYLVASLINAFEINESNIMHANNTYVVDSNNKYKDYYENPIFVSKYEEGANKNSTDLIDLYDEGKISKFNLQNKAIGGLFSSTLVDFDTEFYLYERIEIGDLKVLYGSTSEEDVRKQGIVITKGLAKKLISDSNSKLKVEQLVGKNLLTEKVDNGADTFTTSENYRIDGSYKIDAILDTDSLCGFIPQYKTDNKASVRVSPYDTATIQTNVCYISGFNNKLRYFKSYKEEQEVVKANKNYSISSITGTLPQNDKEVLINSLYLTEDTKSSYYNDGQKLQEYLKYMGFTITGVFSDRTNVALGLIFYESQDRFMDLLPAVLGEYEFVKYDQSISYSNMLNYYDVNKDIIVHNTAVENQTKIYILIALIIALCLYIYFTYRSRMFTDIKKIGIRRAIGETRKDIIINYALTTFIESIFTIFIGFVFASIFYAVFLNISNTVNNVYTASFYTNYLFYISFIGIMVLNIIFGCLPSVLLMRKTPSEIIAKYDI